MNDLFDPTSWTKIRRAADGAGSEQNASLNALAEAYRPPLLNLARRLGIPEHETADAVQEVLAAILSPTALSRVQRTEGRFSHYLATMLRNHWRQQIRSQLRQHGESQVSESLDELPDPLPDEHDDWVAAIDSEHADHCLARVRQRMAAGHSDPLIFRACWDDLFRLHEDRGQVRRATALNIEPAAYRQRLRVFRRQFREHFQDAVAAGLTDPADLGEECVHLLRLALKEMYGRRGDRA